MKRNRVKMKNFVFIAFTYVIMWEEEKKHIYRKECWCDDRVILFHSFVPSTRAQHESHEHFFMRIFPFFLAETTHVLAPRFI